MPRKHQVPTLVNLALRAVGKFVTHFGRSIVQPIYKLSKQNRNDNHSVLQSKLKCMQHLLSSSVPYHLYDQMAVETLKAIVDLTAETKSTYNDYVSTPEFLSEINTIMSLAKVIVGAHLKSIEFSVWPKIMRHVLYSNLHNMVGLEVLDLGSGSVGWKKSDIERFIINGVTMMPNLLSFVLCFDCTDNIITAIVQHCKKLQNLDVTASRSVTDRSIPNLLECKCLRRIKLYRTSLTISGYADLFWKHLYLEDIGRCDDFGYILEYAHKNEYHLDRFFLLRAFECRRFTIDHVYLLTEICPYITSLAILCGGMIGDLTALATLNLKELKLLCCNFYVHGLNRLLELKGCAITHLHLEHVNGIDLNALVTINQCCPIIESLTFYNCDFVERLSTRPRRLPFEPFKCLERIKCVADCTSEHLEFLLSRCPNIRFIQLGSSTGIRDSTMKKIFTLNQMTKLEELKIVYSTDLSMETVQLLMDNCLNLRRLSELDSWLGITEMELDEFREELRINNVNLDTSQSLSFV